MPSATKPRGGGGAQARRGKRPSSSAHDRLASRVRDFVSSHQSSVGQADHAGGSQRRRRRGGGGGAGGARSLPDSIHDVYEFASSQQQQQLAGQSDADRGSLGSKKARTHAARLQRRATVDGMARAAAASTAPRKKLGARRGQDDRDEEEEEDDQGRDDEDDDEDFDDPEDHGIGPEFDVGEEELHRRVAPEDDEELDSDEAFGESDEERFDAALGGARNKTGKRKAPTDDDGDDEGDDYGEEGDDDDEDDDGMVELSQLLDASSDDDAEDGDEGGGESDVEADERLAKRMREIATMPMKRSAPPKNDGGDDDDNVPSAAGASDGATKKRKRLLDARNEAVAEGVFAAPGGGGAAGGLVSIDDLLSPLAGQTDAGFSSLRKSARALASLPPSAATQPHSSSSASSRLALSSRSAEPRASKRGAGAGPLSAPLPGVVQDRLERIAAYQLSKQEVQGWQPTIKRLREAEHLAFPLQPNQQPHVNSTSAMAANFSPSDEMQRDIERQLREAGLLSKQRMASKGLEATTTPGQHQAPVRRSGDGVDEAPGGATTTLAEAEELAMNSRGLDAEEVARRRAQLRRMRELLFREEQKARRVKKIKSKAFRRVRRKQLERDARLAAEAGLTGDGGGADGAAGEDGTAEREERVRDRALERATLKHKNTGRWARVMLGRRETAENVEARNAVEQQLLRGERLRRRIEGIDSDEELEGSLDEESSDDDDGEGDDEEGGNAKARAFDELAQLEARNKAEREAEEEELARGGGKKGSGVFGMKFMREARQRQARETDAMGEALREELLRESDEEKGGRGEGGDEKQGPGRVGNVSRLGAAGRAMYTPAAPSAMLPGSAKQAKRDRPGERGRQAVDEDEDEDEDEGENGERDVGVQRVAEQKPPTARDSSGKTKHAKVETAGEERGRNVDAPTTNPWLAGGTSGADGATQAKKLSRKHNAAVISRDSSAAERASHRAQRHAARTDAGAAEAAREDATLVIDPQARLRMERLEGEEGGEAARTGTRRRGGEPAGLQQRTNGQTGDAQERVVATNGVDVGADSSEDSEDSEGEQPHLVATKSGTAGASRGRKGVVGGGGGVALRQRDLIAEAFAGDDVTAEFAADKAAIVDADAPKEVDESLPGWGSWSGKGVRKTASQRRREEAARRRHTRTLPGLDASKRRDANMDNVVINERRDRKAERYRAQTLPHPYTSAAQYRLAMRDALGAEWQTAATHQRLTLPRVTTKPGQAIRPLERKF